MEWVLSSPQIHSTFGALGFNKADGYHIDENCNAALETILCNILTEDKTLRSYRRNISFGQNVKKDLIPVLIHAKDDKTVELIIKVLVNLTIPVECLLSIDTMSKSSFGRHTIFELNNLLAATKHAFSDQRTTKVIIDYMKKNLDGNQGKLSPEQCMNINNCLVLLRNILHIPELTPAAPIQNGHTVQNQIIWNIFSQSFDKILINLMAIPEASYFGVTMVQLIALFYKDQHVVTLHKLLNLWLEASLSESSEDNESNTSPPHRGSDDSLPLTSDPTSDSSDTGGSGKSNDEQNLEKNTWSESTTASDDSQTFKKPASTTRYTRSSKKYTTKSTTTSKTHPPQNRAQKPQISQKKHKAKVEKKTTKSESDCGYVTQLENQGSISTSSNEDELPTKKPVHQKVHNLKQNKRINTKTRSESTAQERKRKKIMRRWKTNIINVHGLSHKTPTDGDISNVLKEFTVDFLLKGYNSLVQTLHEQIVTNSQLEIDTSHFFWLVTYFLKFATQIELNLEHLKSVLSYDMVSYLTAEGVTLCEQFELSIRNEIDLKPSIRRLHLVVTAIREFLQAMETYKKLTVASNGDTEILVKLQNKMCETEELRSVLILLLRHYNPKYHTKQYLKDLIVTNHMLLLFLDNAMKEPGYKGTINMHQHVQQFATPKIMCQYGLLLEDYESNGEFVNDCIFTIMHHIGGESDSLITLFQPKILKTFLSIWKSDYEICDDWSDLVNYVIRTFVKNPYALQNWVDIKLDKEIVDAHKTFTEATPPIFHEPQREQNDPPETSNSTDSKNKWSDEEISSLCWLYMQCSSSSSETIDEIVKLLKEEGTKKPRESVVKELFKQNLIGKAQYETFMGKDDVRQSCCDHFVKDTTADETTTLCKQLVNEGKSKYLYWIQKNLLETCYVKIYLAKRSQMSNSKNDEIPKEPKIFNFEMFKQKPIDVPEMSPVSYHSLLSNKSVPLVPWNCEQAAICKDLKFLQMLHKLGFYMPVDSGDVFIRIPQFWTAEYLYELAAKIAPIDTSKLKFSTNDIHRHNIVVDSSPNADVKTNASAGSTDFKRSETLYGIQRSKHVTSTVNFTPMPGTSFNSESMVQSNSIHEENWLELIQKSQEHSLNITRMSETRSAFDSASEAVPFSGDCVLSGFDGETNGNMPSHSPIATPALDTSVGSFKQNTTLFNIPLPEAEDVVSACETASVASDLTRMYVSDEDEKPDLLERPRLTSSRSTRSLGHVAKRQRVHSTFN